MGKTEKAHIKVFITKNSSKFRARVSPYDKNEARFEVTVGGEAWKSGKAKEYEDIILTKCQHILSKLTIELRDNILGNFYESAT